MPSIHSTMTLTQEQINIPSFTFIQDIYQGKKNLLSHVVYFGFKSHLHIAGVMSVCVCVDTGLHYSTCEQYNKYFPIPARP